MPCPAYADRRDRDHERALRRLPVSSSEVTGRPPERELRFGGRWFWCRPTLATSTRTGGRNSLPPKTADGGRSRPLPGECSAEAAMRPWELSMSSETIRVHHHSKLVDFTSAVHVPTRIARGHRLAARTDMAACWLRMARGVPRAVWLPTVVARGPHDCLSVVTLFVVRHQEPPPPESTRTAMTTTAAPVR